MRFSLYAALGPITGPCLAGVVRNIKGGAPLLAGLYAVAWIAVYADLLTIPLHTALSLTGH